MESVSYQEQSVGIQTRQVLLQGCTQRQQRAVPSLRFARKEGSLGSWGREGLRGKMGGLPFWRAQTDGGLGNSRLLDHLFCRSRRLFVCRSLRRICGLFRYRRSPRPGIHLRGEGRRNVLLKPAKTLSLKNSRGIQEGDQSLPRFGALLQNTVVDSSGMERRFVENPRNRRWSPALRDPFRSKNRLFCAIGSAR